MRFPVDVLCGLNVYCHKPKKPSSGIGQLPALPAILKTPPVRNKAQEELSFCVLFLGVSSEVERFLYSD
jgi:hypothetical protein